MSEPAKRRDRLRSHLKAHGHAAILITNFLNVRYLTGFTGDDSYLLLTKNNAVMLSDARYEQQLSEECPDVDAIIRRPPTTMTQIIRRAVQQSKIGKLSFEADSLTVAQRDQLGGELKSTELAGVQGAVEALREIKDSSEIDAIRHSIDLAERAFAVIRASMRPEQTERQVAFELEHQIRLFGGEGCSFPPIIAAGPRAALPHARPTDAPLGDADFILVDWGARAEGYMSDLTRILVAGKIPPKLERVYGVVFQAQQQAIAAIGPGVTMSAVDAAARGVIESAGYGRRFGHGLGHGFGLQIHEAPRLAPQQDRALRAGMVVTVEPGIYLPGWGGVRIEDDVLVTRTGCEVLTHVPKELADCVVPWSNRRDLR
jgi:Xaa-Pro aminopeptidase